MLSKKRKVLLFLIIILGLSAAIIFRLDYRKVKLQYVSKVKIDPIITYYRGKSLIWLVKGGDRLKSYLENELFPRSHKELWKGATLGGRPYPVLIEYKLEWEEGFKPDPEAVYYVGLGCEIEEIKYFYHTKFLYRHLVAHSVSLKPLADRHIITIYKGDIGVAPL
ncbi:MAG: hypothetical protein JXA50_02900 [Deltaproteobacteria bacterium]|nr:hypothetical protein [Deltaproteobacteria bacterium]